MFVELAVCLKAMACSVFVLFLANSATNSAIAAQPALPYRPGELIVKEKPAGQLQALGDFHAARGHQRVKRLRGRADLVRIRPGTTVEQAIAEYTASGRFEYAEPNYILSVLATPNDPSFSNGTQWGLHNQGQNGGVEDADIDAPEAWDIINSASNIVVALIDSGVRYTHEDLQANMWVNPGEIAGNGMDDDGNGIVDDVHGVNFVNNSGAPMDDHGHGTHVAGILGAVGNNGIGISGVAWKVQMMALKFLDNRGNGDTSDAIDAIDYAIENGAKIINASWGGKLYSRALEEAIGRARDKGVIVVAAAGNDSTDIDVTPMYPASFSWDNIVVVAGVSRTDTLDLGYSSFGATSVDLAAPGSSIYSTWHSWDGGYNFQSGSSMAAPMVSGALALMSARFTNDTDRALIDRLLAATDPLPSLAGRCVTAGRLNLKKALGNQTIADFTLSTSHGVRPLNVTLQNRSLGEFERLEWDFGTGEISNAPNPTYSYTEEGEYIITLRLYGPEGVVGYKTRTVKVAANYQVTTGTEPWIDPSQFTILDLGDNDVETGVALPFPFRFYSQIYSNINISANGLLGFLTNQMQLTGNQDIPSSIAPHAIIAPHWDNLNPAVGGTVTFGVVGQEPARKFVVSWNGVPKNGSDPLPFTFQAVLEERSERIWFNYLEVHPLSSRGGGRAATVGIKDETGRIGVKYTFDGSPALLTNGQTVIFTPTLRAGLVVQALNSSESFAPIEIGTAEPQGFEYRLANDGNGATEWNAGVNAGWLTLTPDDGVIAASESVTVSASLTEAAASLPPGSHSASIFLTNAITGRVQTRTVHLQVIGTNATMLVEAPAGLIYWGSEGGPFGPATTNIVIKATGDAPVQWTFSSDVEWVGATPQFGFLNPGEQVTVRVGISEPGALLDSGMHTGNISFYNVTSGDGDFTSEVELRVRKPITILAAGNQTQSPFVFTFTLSGPPGEECVVEATTDFLQWTPIFTNAFNAAGLFEFVDENAANFPRRFYRAVER